MCAPWLLLVLFTVAALLYRLLSSSSQPLLSWHAELTLAFFVVLYFLERLPEALARIEESLTRFDGQIERRVDSLESSLTSAIHEIGYRITIDGVANRGEPDLDALVRTSASATVVIASTSTGSYSPKINVDVIVSQPSASPKGHLIRATC